MMHIMLSCVQGTQQIHFVGNTQPGLNALPLGSVHRLPGPGCFIRSAGLYISPGWLGSDVSGKGQAEPLVLGQAWELRLFPRPQGRGLAGRL